jgi:hypothetical protein
VKSERIFLDAVAAMVTLTQPVQALLLSSFIVLGLVVRLASKAIVIQKNLLAAPSHCCICCAEVDTSCSCFFGLRLLLVLYERYSMSRASFLNCL